MLPVSHWVWELNCVTVSCVGKTCMRCLCCWCYVCMSIFSTTVNYPQAANYAFTKRACSTCMELLPENSSKHEWFIQTTGKCYQKTIYFRSSMLENVAVVDEISCVIREFWAWHPWNSGVQNRFWSLIQRILGFLWI